MVRYDFLEWLKAIGITFVIYGHVAHATTVPLTPPVYLKQFGVICFLFATTFTLARDTRPTSAAVFTRLFPIFLFGLSTAATLTAIGALTGTSLLPSNYLPFTLGANVVFDHFPANPSTWYLGTYIHLILLWALVRGRLRVRLWMVFAALLVEVPVRAALIMLAGSYVAYMALTNWLAVCLFGLWWGGRFDGEPAGLQRAGLAGPQHEGLAGLKHEGLAGLKPRPPYVTRQGVRAAVLVACAGVVVVSTRAFAFEPAFPFMSVSGWPMWSSALVVSAMASTLYLGGAVVLFELTRRIGTTPLLVALLARNSLLVFLIHMPLYFALRTWLIELGLSYEARALVQFVICLPVLALVSEGILRVVPVKSLARRTVSLVSNFSVDVRKSPASLVQEP